MNLYRTFQWFSGGLGWSPLSELWQVDGLARTYRDPSIPTLPLEDPPVGEIKRNPTIQQGPGPRSINPITVTNLLITTLAVVAAAAPFKARSEVVSPDHRQRAVVATQQHNLLTSTLAVATDTTVKRDPLLAQQHRKRDVVDTTRGMPVQLRPVATVALPPGQATPFTAPQEPQWSPGDESSGTPKTLYGDATRPANNEPSLLVALPRVLGDTSQSQPPTLRAVVAPPPLGQAAHQLAPPLPRNVADTSSGSPSTLLPIVVAALPPGEAAYLPPIARKWHATPLSWRPEGAPAVDTGPLPIGQQSSIAPPKLKWLPADESAGTPKPLYIDDQIPGSNLYEQISLRDARRDVVDTSRSSFPITSAPAVVQPLPPGKASFVAAPRHVWTVVDASQSAWIVTHPLPPLPVGAAAFVAAPRTPWTVLDTSQPAVAAQRAPVVVPLPPGEASHVSAPRTPWGVVDTSRSAYALAFPAPLPPGAASFVAAPRFVWAVADTSEGAWALANQPLPPPPGQASFVAAPRFVWKLTDASSGAWPTLHPLPPLPIGKASYVAAPRFAWQVVDTSQSKAFQLGDGSTVIVTTPGPAGGGFRRPFHDHVRASSPDSHRGRSPNTRRGRQ